jgi:carboxylesterase
MKGRDTSPEAFDELARPLFHPGDETGCLVLHGFTGTPANVRVVADKLAEAGYTVYAPLLSGHGTTLRDMDAQTGAVWMNDALKAYDRLLDAGCTRIFLLGLSMGGILCALTAQQRHCDGLVLMSTPFRMRRYLRNAMRLSPALKYLITERGGARHAPDPYAQGYPGVPLRKLRDLDELTLRARGGLYKLICPILILQSELDNRVDMKSVPIAQYGVRSTDVTTILLHHSPHGCSYGPERDLVAAYCLEFVQRISAGLPPVQPLEPDGSEE